MQRWSCKASILRRGRRICSRQRGQSFAPRFDLLLPFLLLLSVQRWPLLGWTAEAEDCGPWGSVYRARLFQF
jgi:hypothetical protein